MNIVLIVVGMVVGGILMVMLDGPASSDHGSDADQSESGTSNTDEAIDYYARKTNGTNEPLIQMHWYQASHGLKWSDVVITLSVGNNTWNCTPYFGTASCRITQDGPFDDVWEHDEVVLLSESGSDIADGSTTIDMYDTYRGTADAGSDDVTVALV